MSYKQYNYQNFSCELPNKQVKMFVCHTENTRYGFRHLCRDIDTGVVSKRCYYNRTWERFEYESVLLDAISKLPKAEQGIVHAHLIDKTADRIKQECENFINAFKQEYKKATPQMKQALSKVNIQTPEQAKSVLAITTAFNLMQGNK